MSANNASPPRGRSRRWRWPVALSILLAALSVGLGSGCSASAPAPSTASASASPSQCAPYNVTNRRGKLHPSVEVAWDAPASCVNVVHYSVVELGPNSTAGTTVVTVPATARADETIAVPSWCTYYRYGVVAVSGGHHQSAVVLPPAPVFTSYTAAPNPPVVSILIPGIHSSGPEDSFNAQTADYCTSKYGELPPKEGYSSLVGLTDIWLNYTKQQDGSYDTDPSTVGSGNTNNLVDSLASTGGYVLPFSYRGATVSGTPDHPVVTEHAYTTDDVGTTTIQEDVARLNTEVTQVHAMWPNTKILVVGHSNGGLIAEQWWLNHRRSSDLDGVVQIFSLDSPLNGLLDAGYCSIHLCGKTVGPNLGDFYSGLWFSQASNDPYWVSQDSQDKIFTAVGTYGDPLYDVGDNGATNLPTTDARIGILSQLYFTEPSCAKERIDPFDLSTSRCHPTGRYFIDPCAIDHGRVVYQGGGVSAPLDIDWGPPGIPPGFGAPGSLWMHSVVKNCPGVIADIMEYVPVGAPKDPPLPTACTRSTFLSVVHSKDYGSQIGAQGQPTCANGYALQVFTPYPGGQAAQFIFKQAADGSWNLIEGGDALPTVACRTIPAPVLTKLGASCPQSPSPATGSTAPVASCRSTVFLQLMQSQDSTVTSAAGPPTCLAGYAEQDFNYPKGSTANYPTFFFQQTANGSWTILGGGAIGDVMSVCSALPDKVRQAFLKPTTANSGCPAG
jgi:hypothetical protein